jgi:TldD protein
MPVVLDQELAGVFAHEAVGHASEADLVLEGDSILENRIGEQIASPLINIIDDPTLHEFGYYPFDAEGSESKRTEIIKDGIFNSYLHSRETAAKLGGTPGNCRAQGYSMPVVRMSNTFIDNGDSRFEEMLEEVKDGMYLIGSRGGQVNTGEGIFQFNAEKGYLIKNGELTGLLRDVSLSGKTLEILNHVTLVGNDLKMTAGRCGKAGQLVPVSDGSPHIAISKALVGGA